MDSESASKTNPISVNDLIRDAGFTVMLTWHYLVLFTPIFSNGYVEMGIDNLSVRQFTLYLSLAVSFTLIAALSPHISRRFDGFENDPRVLWISGLVSTAISLLCAVPPFHSLEATTLFTVALGACEAIMMWLWLSCIFSVHRDYDILREFSLNMAFAGVLSLLICYLQGNANSIVSALLPGISTCALFYEAKRLREIKKERKIGGGGAKSSHKPKNDHDEAPRELDWNQTIKAAKGSVAAKPDPKKDKPRFRITSGIIGKFFTMSVIGIFAFVFGLIQGTFVKNDIYLLMADRPLVLLAIVLAGLIIYAAPKKHGAAFGANVVHYYALVLVVLGIVILFQAQIGDVALLVAEIAILAGFNLFDSSAMMLGIGSSIEQDDRIVHIASGGRPVVYSCLLLGLLLGHSLVVNDVLASNITTTVCGVSIVLLVATTLIPYYSYNMSASKNTADQKENESKILRNADEIIAPPLSSPMLPLNEQAQSKKLPITPWRSTCAEIAKLYQLSPREAEVFNLLAKGRNAAFIQEKLVISPHTAKTHVANIYRKLEIHSSQDLLDLVESFREAERHFSEDD